MDSTPPASQGEHRAGRTTRVLAPIAVLAITVACFLPTMRNGFVNWDDPAYFLRNADYQTVSWDSAHWAITTRHGGHYQPLIWLTFIADHALTPIIGPAGPRAADDPCLYALAPKVFVQHPPSAGRFHQTQAILHGVAAVLIYFLALRLSQRTEPFPQVSVWAAVFAALVFALHPLRVESVAWATARADVVAAIFMLSATLVYLRGFDGRTHLSAPSRALVAMLMLLALGSKVMAVTLPAALMVLDVYLGRFKQTSFRTLLLEKTELFALSLPGFFVARWAHVGAMPDLAAHSLSNRLGQASISLAFYPYKTLVPAHLSPLYEFPVGFAWTHRWVLYAATALAAVAAILALARFPRRSAVLCTLAAYAILIAPVSGLSQRGPQMLADRYSYIACIPFALLAGGAAVALSRRNRALAVFVAVATLVGLAFQTQRQIRIWRDSKALWEHAIALDPTNAMAHLNLASALASAGENDRAAELVRRLNTIVQIKKGFWNDRVYLPPAHDIAAPAPPPASRPAGRGAAKSDP